jgi:PQ loop repeat
MQLIQNFTRGHADGLSASMFICAIGANVTGSTGILVRLESRTELIWQLPWLLGAYTAVVLVAKHPYLCMFSATNVALTQHRDIIGPWRIGREAKFTVVRVYHRSRLIVTCRAIGYCGHGCTDCTSSIQICGQGHSSS